jgi:hypothetical protein
MDEYDDDDDDDHEVLKKKKKTEFHLLEKIILWSLSIPTTILAGLLRSVVYNDYPAVVLLKLLSDCMPDIQRA